MTQIDAAPAPGPGLIGDLTYWLAVARRRFWTLFAVWVAVALVGVGVAYVLPPVYESRALILVETQRISPDLVRSTVSSPAGERIALIRQRLLTRETMLELAERHRLFPEGADISPTRKVEAMRRAIVLEQAPLGNNPGWNPGAAGATAFTVAFTAAEAETAAAVVNDLVTRILAQNTRLRRDRAETTSAFFAQEAQRLADELARQEAAIIAFMREHEDSLPDSLDYRRDQLDLLQERAAGLELRRLELEQERSSLTFILDSVESPAQSALERGLEAARRALMERSAVLSSQHPEIRSLRSRVQAFEAAVAAERAARAQAPAGTDAAPPPPAAVEARRRLAFIDAQIAHIGNRLTELEAQRAALERTILATPNVEIALNALRRQYEETESRYRDARAKLAEAQAGEQLEFQQQGERMEVIEPPVVPEWPIRPNRLKMAVASVAAGLAAGLGLIVLLELLSGVVRRSDDLERIGRRPVAVLPYVTTTNERRRVWAVRLLAAAAVFGGGAAALWAIDAHVMPLELLARKALERSGLEGWIELVRRRLG
ncbi:GumC family protein [Oceanicella actignis]|uniref:Polysaccharide chain length determinant protein, PEP-CTERM locus subfamily n=1 Tax=Oceanicella actignis TaxID=1189325 RepID=A0A1M7T563_9RHOB|nr:Wzz/FepE/Etk N-terminal domain-containing protein [Oceanicella actignis]TYO88747.1 polysaccharide chain length determinant protein (PEP-CTERM system associated) [Oceanicella actignis]SET42794.1 polysaccharide chain length determinant protein, PEP-CTERM locus subfamily [Oceanicella actignis]SHN65854.1 polysaccharide chain length determinant protein, PEP-CTERM locus subfamily [Oceanicella actignis]